MNNNLYAIKDTCDLTFKTKEGTYKLDYANEVHVQNYINSYNKKNTLILVFAEVKNDNMPQYANNIELSFKCVNMSRTTFEKTEEFNGNFNLVYSSYILNCDNPTEFVYAFCDGDVKSGYIKKEINEILNRRKQDELIGATVRIQNLSNCCNSKETKDLYFNVELIDNGIRCEICFDGIITYLFGNNIKEIADYIIPIIIGHEHDVKIYGDKSAFGISLADQLESRGYTIEPTPIVRLGKILK